MRQIIIGCLLMLWSSLFVQGQDLTPQELADEDGQFATINEVELYYIARGSVDDPAVILIHGFGGSTFTWRDNMNVLVDAGYYVVALDLPPFGLSDKSPDIDYRREAYADYIAGLMDVLEIERATLVGHSIGGSTTAYFAVRYPERIERLVFVAGGLFDSQSLGIQEAEDASDSSPLGLLNSIDLSSDEARFILETALIPTTFAGLIESAYYDPSIMTDEVVAGYARPVLVEDWAPGFIAYWQAVDNEVITLNDLAEAVNDLPILIIWGEEDSWVPLTMGRAMQEAFTNSTLITYEAVGHLPMEEAIERFNNDLIAFLGES